MTVSRAASLCAPLTTLPAALLAALLAACSGPASSPSPEAVAWVAGREVPYERFEEYLARNLGEVDSALPSEVLSQLFDQFIDELLLAELATGRGLAPAQAPVRQAMSLLLAGEEETLEPSEQAVREYYQARRGDFVRPERVRLAQILVEDRATAEKARAAIAAGEDFADVARRFSQEPAAEIGGDQGELGKGDLPVAFAEPIFALSPGQTSAIVEADYGFHIFQVLDRKPAEELPLEAVEEEIRDKLRRKAVAEKMVSLLREARTRYNPKVYERNVPFNYLGRYSTPPDP